MIYEIYIEGRWRRLVPLVDGPYYGLVEWVQVFSPGEVAAGLKAGTIRALSDETAN